MNKTKSFKYVICPHCEKEFQLSYEAYTEVNRTLEIEMDGCGNIWRVLIVCPNCCYEEVL